jgi:MFS family permease
MGLTDANEKTLRMAKIFTGLLSLNVLSSAISTTFYLIFVAEALGGGPGRYEEGLAAVAILVVIRMVIHTLLDYPTGAIGDYIGQRYLLASAFITYAIAFFMVSLVTTETPFFFLIIIYALLGFATSQESGALGAWFDNNYRVVASEDENRIQYGIFQGKISMLAYIIDAIVMIPGSLLAVLISRSWVFQVQAFLFMIIAILSIRFVRDYPETKEEREGSLSIKEYASVLKGGISFLFSSPFITLLIVGTILTMSSMTVWAELILFPMYFSYLILEVAVASLRTLLKTPYAVYSERSGVWAKRFEPKKWISRLAVIQTCGFVFYSLFALIMFILPPPSGDSPMLEFLFPFTDIVFLIIPIGSILPITLMIILWFISGVFLAIRQILTQRVLLDAIPNEVRNSVYSLFPTIHLLLAMPQIIIFGWVISEFGVPLALFLCGLVSLAGALMLGKAFTYPMPERAKHSEAPSEELEFTLEEELADMPLDEYSDESDI